MLRALHKYRRSLFGLLLVGSICLVLSGFGLYGLESREERFAIQVDDRGVSYEDFARRQRQLEEQYRGVFGKSYLDIINRLQVNIAQQAVDRTINDILLEQEARRRQLVVGKEEVRNIIHEELFQQGFDKNLYAAYLRDMGLTAQQFESQISEGAMRLALTQALTQSVVVSDEEARAAVVHDEAKFDVSFVEFDPATFETDIAPPADDELEAYFKEHSSGYELPQRISYDYVLLDPQKFQDLVQISDEDIELYYADKQSQFMNPEQLQLRQIVFDLPEKASADEKKKIQTQAEEIRKRAFAGESFEALAREFSSDAESKLRGGDRGYVSRAELPAALGAAVAKLKEGEISELVEAGNKLFVVRVEKRVAAEAKPLSEVRGTIEKAIREQEAPSYTAERARELFEQWQKGGAALAEFATRNNLVAASTNGLFDADKDPEDAARGLTAKVIANPGEERQLVDVGEKSVIVAVRQFKDIEIPPLVDVKDKVLAALRKSKAQRRAEEVAGKFVDALKQDAAGSVRALAVAQGLAVKEEKGATPANRSKAPFSDEHVGRVLFAETQPLKKIERSFTVSGKYYVFQIDAINRPDADVIKAKLPEYKQKLLANISQELVTSLTNSLKARAKIEVDPNILARES